jgi:Fe-S-cluster containining protein
MPGFPEPLKEDGLTCSHLTLDGRCGIYERRPLCCRMDEGWAYLTVQGQLPKGTTKREWFMANSEACNRMIDEDGLDPKFKIDVSRYGPS